MATFKITIRLTSSEQKKISQWLSTPLNYDDYLENYLHEDETFVVTAEFSNGYQMDIKCCGVSYEDDSINSAWTEAVLFDENGHEVACSDVDVEYYGLWELSDRVGNTYSVLVV